MFDAVLCDIDGVLRIWDPAAMTDLDLAYGLPPGALAGAAFRPDLLLPAVTGAVADGEWRAAVAADLAAACGGAERARALVAEWSAVGARVDREVAALLARVRRRVPVVLVSNATTRLEADLTALGLATADAGSVDGMVGVGGVDATGGAAPVVCDAVVNSSRIGVAKPDPRVYRLAAERAGVEVTRCLFVDDTEGHVAAAREVGMTGLHYRRVAQLREALHPLVQMAAIRDKGLGHHSEEG
ncbi:HAD family hydrolase [Streptomyces johnsoniae]|uniref:HAD family hydrolase n=1 Tax=Streptomyces johnsoniae TaxID=3075532 RepID=A0ABU2S8U1_9ACTN|nr:HAD family hydrolase [Streptomyces sp. DSM 41886]MDT0445403.1 HAD family hydrolase [Streptomyces sp. DSM 41886]